MAVISYPFVSVAGDRKYGPADIAAIVHTQNAGSNGVVQGYLNSLAVTSLGSYQTQIDTGGAFFDGYAFQSNSAITLTHDGVAAGSKRYDLIVFTLDTVVSRNFSAAIVKGTASAGTPTVPTAGVFDTVLARLYIDNTTGTPAYTLVDLRTYQAVSGSSASILSKLLTVDGAGSNLDSDLLDGQQGSYYQNSSNQNAGTLPVARLPAFTGDVTATAGTGSLSLAASTVLAKLLTVDGSGSGLDADLLDGQQGAYYQNSSNQNAGTLPVARLPALTGDVTATAGTGSLSLAAATVLSKLLTVDGSGSGLDADTVRGVVFDLFSTVAQVNGNGPNTKQYFYTVAANGAAIIANAKNDGTNYRYIVDGKAFYVGVDRAKGLLYAEAPSGLAGDIVTWGPEQTIWRSDNDGSGSGLDADLLDGQQGSYYQNSSNQNAGTLPVGRLPALTGDVTATAGTGSLSLAAATVLSKLLTVDGSGSGLDADLVRGVTPGSGGLAALAKSATIWASDNSNAFKYYNGGTVSGSVTLPSINVGETMVAWYNHGASYSVQPPSTGTYNWSVAVRGASNYVEYGVTSISSASVSDDSVVTYTRIS